jgi:hypothetical protein
MRGDAFLTADSPDDLGIDKDFSKAQDYLADADAALAALEPGTEPTKPERGKAYESPSDLTDLGDEDDDSLDSWGALSACVDHGGECRRDRAWYRPAGGREGRPWSNPVARRVGCACVRRGSPTSGSTPRS